MKTLLALCALTTFATAADGWQPLFNGKDLDGWKPNENPRLSR